MLTEEEKEARKQLREEVSTLNKSNGRDLTQEYYWNRIQSVCVIPSGEFDCDNV